MKRKKMSGTDSRIGYVIGLTMSVVVMICGILLTSFLVLQGIVGQGSVGLILYIALMVAVTSGGAVAGIKSEGNITKTAVAIGITLLIILFGLGLIMDGRFTNPVKTIFAVFSGFVASCVLSRKKSVVRRKKK